MVVKRHGPSPRIGFVAFEKQEVLAAIFPRGVCARKHEPIKARQVGISNQLQIAPPSQYPKLGDSGCEDQRKSRSRASSATIS